MQFKFEIGGIYETLNGKKVRVIGRTRECIECGDEIYRYDRGVDNPDSGRVTGTDFDYSCPDNFKK